MSYSEITSEEMQRRIEEWKSGNNTYQEKALSFNGRYWTAMDNTEGLCELEEFTDKMEALVWLDEADLSTKKGISDKDQWDIFNEALLYYKDSVAPLYLDLIAENPVEGLYQALTDFLTNDSYWDDKEGIPLTWEEILKDMTIRN